MKNVITTEVNDNPVCIEQLCVMLQSLKVNAPHEIIQVFACNWSEDIYKKVVPINGNAIFVKRQVPGSWILSVHQQPANIIEAINNGADKIAHMDVDVIVRTNIDALWRSLYPNTLKIQYRPFQPDKRKFQNGVFAIGVGKWTIKMIMKLQKKIETNNKWYEDQLQLWKCYMKYDKNISFQMLDNRYNDNKFDNESYIWHCCVKHKQDNEIWNREFEHYLRAS